MECRGSESQAHGIRVTVHPFHIPGAVAADGNFVFGYRVTIRNDGVEPVRLLWRRWLIEDGQGRRREVAGAGVVGEQPLLDPGEQFEYQSACALPTPWGTMEGAYTFQRSDESMFEAPIEQFWLAAAEDA